MKRIFIVGKSNQNFKLIADMPTGHGEAFACTTHCVCDWNVVNSFTRNVCAHTLVKRSHLALDFMSADYYCLQSKWNKRSYLIREREMSQKGLQTFPTVIRRREIKANIDWRLLLGVCKIIWLKLIIFLKECVANMSWQAESTHRSDRKKSGFNLPYQPAKNVSWDGPESPVWRKRALEWVRRRRGSSYKSSLERVNERARVKKKKLSSSDSSRIT